MHIDIKNTKVYVISPGTGIYTNRILTVFHRLVQYGFQRVEFVRSLPGQTNTLSLTNTVIDICKRELSGDAPFIILEDDCAVFTEYDKIELPDDSDVLYLGVSKWMYPFPLDTLYLKRRPPIFPNSSKVIASYNDLLTKIVGLTGGHAILFISREFMRTFIAHMTDISRYTNNLPHDLLFAALQPSFNVYALKNPMFYQDITLGGQEAITRLTFNGECYQ